VSWRVVPLAKSITTISESPSVVRSKTMALPSGDHAG
jgi:hypothetical protein